MSHLMSLDDLKDLSGYKKDLKKCLERVQASPARMFYAPAFEFKGKRGPVVLVGELPSGLIKGLKEARVPLKTGRCRRNRHGEIEVFKGLEPAKIRVVLKQAGIAETIADREIADEAEESPVAASEVRAPEEESAHEEFRKRSEAAFKAREKDVLVELQRFVAGHKDDPAALLGIKDVKSQIIAARELAARERFDEALAALDRMAAATWIQAPASNAYDQEPPSSGQASQHALSNAYGQEPPSSGQAPRHPLPPNGDARPRIDKEFIEKMKEIRIPKGKFEDAAQTEENPFGFKTKSVGNEYVGEHEKGTWRTGVNPDDPRFITRKYTDEERARMTLDVDGGGVVRNADGSVTNESTEYVLDPRTGKMVKLPGTMEAVSVDPATGERIRTVISPRDSGRALKEGKRVEAVHHSTALGGYDVGEGGQPVLKGVANAGSVTVENGKVKRVSNASGHYKPKLVQILQTVEHLARQGALLDKTLVDAEGHKLSDAHPGAFALYQAVTKARAGAKQHAAEARKIMARMDEVVKDAGAAGADEQIKALDDELDRSLGELLDIKTKTDRALKLLTRIGAGPANKIDPGAKVEFIDGGDDITGLEFRMKAKTTISPAEQFMKSGGGNQQQVGTKNALMDELKAKTAATRERLDKKGIVTEADGPMPTEDDFQVALKDLESSWMP